MSCRLVSAVASGKATVVIPRRLRLGEGALESPKSERATHDKTGHFARSHAFSTLAVERDVRVAKDVIDELIHGGLLESTRLARFRRELSRTLDLLGQEL